MRIISGSAKGKMISAPKGLKTRPTAARIKESLFSILQAHIVDSRVLDLFAGSGNLGLEAISRGAAEAFFVDKDRGSIQVIKENIKQLGFSSQSQVIQADYLIALKQLKKMGESFDVVFLDPPYKKGFISSAIHPIIEMGLIDENGWIIAEHDSKDTIMNEKGIFKVVDVRYYGTTSISFIMKDVTTI